MFLSKFADDKLKNCEILSDLCNNVSDHYPLMCSLSLKINETNNNLSINK